MPLEVAEFDRLPGHQYQNSEMHSMPGFYLFLSDLMLTITRRSLLLSSLEPELPTECYVIKAE